MQQTMNESCADLAYSNDLLLKVSNHLDERDASTRRKVTKGGRMMTGGRLKTESQHVFASSDNWLQTAKSAEISAGNNAGARRSEKITLNLPIFLLRCRIHSDPSSCVYMRVNID